MPEARRRREATVERHLVNRCTALGLLCWKFTSPSHRGVPDRIVIGHDAQGSAVTLFIELKRPGAAPRPEQSATIATMRDHGAHALVADSIAAVDQILLDYIERPTATFAERDPHRAALPGRQPLVISAMSTITPHETSPE